MNKILLFTTFLSFSLFSMEKNSHSSLCKANNFNSSYINKTSYNISNKKTRAHYISSLPKKGIKTIVRLGSKLSANVANKVTLENLTAIAIGLAPTRSAAVANMYQVGF